MEHLCDIIFFSHELIVLPFVILALLRREFELSLFFLLFLFWSFCILDLSMMEMKELFTNVVFFFFSLLALLQ